MASSQNIAPDSARDLNDVIGNDSTATFEDDPTFVESNPTGAASSENLGAGDVDESDEDDDIEDDDELDEDDEDDDEEEEEGEEVDEDEEEEAFDEDDDDEDEDEDDEDSEGNEAAPALSADGLLQYEDEAEDAKEGRSRERGDAVRSGQEAALKDGEDDDSGDVGEGVDEDALNADEALDLDDDDSVLTTHEADARRRGLRTLVAMPVPVSGTWMALS